MKKEPLNKMFVCNVILPNGKVTKIKSTHIALNNNSNLDLEFTYNGKLVACFNSAQIAGWVHGEHLIESEDGEGESE